MRSLAVPLCILLTGCTGPNDPLTPDAGVGGAGTTYVLRSAAGRPIPAVWIRNPSVSVTVLADTIRLRGQGRGSRVLVEEYLEEVPGTPVKRNEAIEFEYVRQGDRIEISFPCPGLALCVAPPHFVGRVTNHGLVFDHALSYAVPLGYERVGP
jgi:hypothetical protein